MYVGAIRAIRHDVQPYRPSAPSPGPLRFLARPPGRIAAPRPALGPAASTARAGGLSSVIAGLPIAAPARLARQRSRTWRREDNGWLPSTERDEENDAGCEDQRHEYWVKHRRNQTHTEDGGRRVASPRTIAAMAETILSPPWDDGSMELA